MFLDGLIYPEREIRRERERGGKSSDITPLYLSVKRIFSRRRTEPAPCSCAGGKKGSTTHIYLSRNKGGRNADTKYKIRALRCAHRKELGKN